MKSRMLARAVSVALLLGMFALPAVATAEPANSINLMGAGLVGPDLSASVFGLEYERLLNDSLSIMGRFANLDYKYDDDVYEEDGDGSGFDVGVRFYPGGNGMRGFFLGGNVGFWSTDWTWIDDKDTGSPSQGDGTTDSFKVEFEVGGRFPLGSETVSLMPAAHIGSFVGQDSECRQTQPTAGTCTEESEVGFYVLRGLSLGIAF